MIIKIKANRYKILLYRHLIPYGFERIVSKFNHEPDEGKSLASGNALYGKVALITGAHKGIGYSIAKRLIQDGAKVIITGRDKPSLINSVNSLGASNATYIQWDIQNQNECESKFKEALSIYGRLDILVNNAGVTTDRKCRVDFEEMDFKHIRYVHSINAIGTRNMCITYTNMNKKGTILNIISNTGIRPAQDAYHTSKWALFSFTKAYANELVGKNVTINGICPGPIRTDMSFDSGTSIFRSDIPNRRMGLAEEIAELAFVQILAGLEGSSGMVTICDGGEALK